MQIGRRRTMSLGPLMSLLLATLMVAAGPVSAAGPIEAMPLWRLQVKITTGTDSTRRQPTLRLNSTSLGVRRMYPFEADAFKGGRVHTYDLRLLPSPSAITMLRLGLDVDQDHAWCVTKIQLLFNERLAFTKTYQDKSFGCMVWARKNIDIGSARLRADGDWTRPGWPTPLPSRMTFGHLKKAVVDVTGSALLSSPGTSWDRSIQPAVVRLTSKTFRVSFGLSINRNGDGFSARVAYTVRLFVGSDGRLHATKTNLSCRPTCTSPGENLFDAANRVSDTVVAHLDTALSRMTARPAPHDPLGFGIDAFTNISWRYVPIVG